MTDSSNVDCLFEIYIYFRISNFFSKMIPKLINTNNVNCVFERKI